MIKIIDNHPPEPSRPERGTWRWGIFLAGWTVFVSLAVWWLLRRVPTPDLNPTSFIEGGPAANAAMARRLGNWLKLADLSFHQIYPWILLAPYAGWLGVRFLLERGRWRASLTAHLAGCALFATACHALDAYADRWRPVLVTVSALAVEANRDAANPAGKTGQTNEVITIVTNAAAWVQGGGLAGAAGWSSRGTRSNLPGRVSGGHGGSGGWGPPPDGLPFHNRFFVQRHFAASPLDVLNVFAYASLVGLVQTVRFRRQSRERERRAAALEAQLTQARLHALQAQLHPHFLFNALNAISTLLRHDTRQAQDTLASFSELLRMALSYSTQPEVTLREDLEFLRRYVEIQQTRLGDRLCFEETIAPETLDCLVPALLLQPLVENAIRHGIEPSAHPGLVRVVVQPQGERLALMVQDNGAGLSSKEDERGAGAGIGLQNLASRLETLYGAGHKIEFVPRPEGGVTVTIEIPARRAPAATP